MAPVLEHQLKTSVARHRRRGWVRLAVVAALIFGVGLLLGFLAARIPKQGARTAATPEEGLGGAESRETEAAAGFTMTIERVDGAKLIGSVESAGGAVQVIVLLGQDTRLSALVPKHQPTDAETGEGEPPSGETASYGEIALKPGDFRAGDIVRVSAPGEIRDGAVVFADSVTWLMRVIGSVSGSRLVTTDFEESADDDSGPGKGLPAPF